jgi:hypothetical protein
LSRAIRVSGNALDKIGQALETNPHVDRCTLLVFKDMWLCCSHVMGCES